ncbi:MAG: glutamine-hydrolyzing carbamoyl-phosphate synthase small subunit [Planctomycetota bacterium]|nr:glutamine-hydrolyzing carbamoyl-phosphate synthase small subunit [Planctomycetota bacterium]
MLVLADGSVFRGRAFGASGERAGEVVFNTAMTGYQEIATDPSYAGQIVCMTYPHIGNYGSNDEDLEAGRPWIEGMVVRELSPIASNFRSDQPLEDWYERTGVVGIEGIDTRRLTRRLRVDGAVNGVLSSVDLDELSLLKKAKALPSMEGQDLAGKVTCDAPYAWDTPWPEPWFRKPDAFEGDDMAPLKIVAIDFGAKRNILRSLVTFGLQPTVVPATTSADAILAMEPDGVFLSNGPGDPAAVTYGVDTVRTLLGKVPMFGICLGHQIMALAAGAKTYKLKFGHRGANHPVREHATGRIEITSQNHGFVVDAESLGDTGFEPTHTNLNDMTNAGIACEERRAFGVQFHPEAAPGPHDAQHLFGRFRRLIRGSTAPA